MTDPDLGLILHIDGEEAIDPELRGLISWAHAKVVSMVESGDPDSYAVIVGNRIVIHAATVAGVLHAGNIYTAVVMDRGEGEVVRRGFIHREGAFVISGRRTIASPEGMEVYPGIPFDADAFKRANSCDPDLLEAVSRLNELVNKGAPPGVPGVAGPSQI